MSISLGLPKGLLPTPEIAMSAGAVSQLVRVQPNNIAAITQNAQNLPSGTANAATNSLTFPSQLVSFSVPCGQGKHVWIDSAKSTLSFRVQYNVVAGGGTTAYAAADAYLQGGATSFWNRIVHIGPNGQTIDDVVNMHVSEHIDQLLNLNAPDRDCFAAAFGFQNEAGVSAAYNTVQGHQISSLTGTLPTANSIYSYEIPLPSALLGKYAKSMFPCGAVSKLDLQLYTNSFLPITVHIGTAAATPAATLAVTIDNISLNLWMITLDAESARLLGSPAVHSIHGITQRTATASLASGTTGYLNTLIGLRGKSCRQLYTRFVDQGTVGSAVIATGVDQAINGWADSKMPIASQLNYLIAGKDRYPQFPHNTQLLPASVFSRLLMCSEKYELWQQHSSFVPNRYFRYPVGQTATAGTADQRIVDAGSKTSVYDVASFVFGEDLRKAHSSQCLDGVDLTVTANHFLEMNLLSGCTNTQSVYFTGFFDIIFEVDMNTGYISYRM